MPSKHKIVPIAESEKSPEGRVLLICEHRGKLLKMTFNAWGELLDRDYKLIKRAYYAGHTARVCLGFDPWPNPGRLPKKAIYSRQIADNLYDKLARRGLCPQAHKDGVLS